MNATAYGDMTESFEASYANFRFYSEVLLADVMPREIEGLFLAYHNARGGRLGVGAGGAHAQHPGGRGGGRTALDAAAAAAQHARDAPGVVGGGALAAHAGAARRVVAAHRDGVPLVPRRARTVERAIALIEDGETVAVNACRSRLAHSGGCSGGGRSATQQRNLVRRATKVGSSQAIHARGQGTGRLFFRRGARRCARHCHRTRL